MNSGSFKLIERLVKPAYVSQAQQAISAQEGKISHLLEQRRCPDVGWEDSTIELLLNYLSLMDSNNFIGHAQVGEREARFGSELVRRRHFRMGHGIGRSGDIAEDQPKAAGSTLMNKLTNEMALNILQMAGCPSTEACLLVPCATGMSAVLCFLTLRQKRPNANFILWPRIDQKSCYKSIFTAGFQPVIIDGQLLGEDGIETNIVEIERQVQLLGAENILCVFTTTSCFAPRCPDNIKAVAELCSTYHIPHVINNAYGVQSAKCMARIEQGAKSGRVDYYVQSTDKNFMVPVGGALIAGFSKDAVARVAKMYPGRASASPTMDLFITLLSVGAKGYRDLCKQRKGTFSYLVEQLKEMGDTHGLRILRSPGNDVSVGMTLPKDVDCPQLGSMLFTRFVFGTRAIQAGTKKMIEGREFIGWGSHLTDYPHNYLTAAVSIGTTKEDVDTFVNKLNKVLSKRRYSVGEVVPSSKDRHAGDLALDL